MSEYNIFIKVLIVFGIYFILTYLFGVIRQKRKYNTWLIPNWKYFSNILKSLSRVSRAIAGEHTATIENKRSDVKYASITLEQIINAHRFAINDMISQGLTKDKYVSELFDCEDFTRAKINGIVKYFMNNENLKGYGIPVFMFWYIKENGKGHSIIKIMENNKINHYFDCYAEHIQELKLTPAEIESCYLEY